MKVIFLDISGTLASNEFNNRRPDGSWLEVDPEAVAVVNKIVEATGARIVISSDWVKNEPEISYPGVQSMLRKHGLVAEFVGHTIQPLHNTVFDRGLEIRDWLSRHPEVTGFVILDDACIPITKEARDYLCDTWGVWKDPPLPPEDPELGEHFIRLDGNKGLLEEHIPKAVEILGG